MGLRKRVVQATSPVRSTGRRHDAQAARRCRGRRRREGGGARAPRLLLDVLRAPCVAPSRMRRDIDEHQRLELRANGANPKVVDPARRDVLRAVFDGLQRPRVFQAITRLV
eukprot:4670214-Pleurochrysis_carterae.AAC.1